MDDPAEKYHGSDPEDTERESGQEIERTRRGPIKPRGPEHSVLYQFRKGERMTAYEASFRVDGDYHSLRRESERLFKRGFLRKNGTLPNEAPRGRDSVDAFEITPEGVEELWRLAREGQK